MVDSPAKKLNFNTADKENLPFDAEYPIVNELQNTKQSLTLDDEISTLKKLLQIAEAKKAAAGGVVEEVKESKAVVVASSIKPDESDEPLLQENASRFVLFPIKYHEVCVTSISRHVTPRHA
jgi:ribonucleoside-diphosphate reductase subunit M2